jgi:sterol 3beta-glucosyltransferase
MLGRSTTDMLVDIEVGLPAPSTGTLPKQVKAVRDLGCFSEESCHANTEASTSRVDVVGACSRLSASDQCAQRILPLPSKLNIVIMAMGTHGDVAPLCILGLKLMKHGNHRVRIATHESHRDFVLNQQSADAGKTHRLEFYPLAGDPKKLATWVAQTQGILWKEVLYPTLIPSKLEMLHSIIHSTWNAATAADPRDSERKPFVADAIISTPNVMGHVHVAEALGVPCHIMSVMPFCYHTSEFPHSIARTQFAPGVPTDSNLSSYTCFQAFIWANCGRAVNELRSRSLRRPPVYTLTDSWIERAQVPFSALWSPSFIPKPHDWPPHCEVVGTLSSDRNQPADSNAPQLAALQQWINEGPAPVFIGFGSMIIRDPPRFEAIVKQVSAKTGLRIVVQSSWTTLNVEIPGNSLLRNVGPCPHDWLLPQCSAVVHHGGSGTTAAGLRHGKPTLICPFFGDQFIWGEFCASAAVGPAPCPFASLTADILAGKLEELCQESTRQNAEAMARKLAMEDGLIGALEHFHEELPRDSMYCDVSAMLGEANLARYEITDETTGGHGIKISSEVAALIEIDDELSRLYKHRLRRHAVTRYNLIENITTFRQGVAIAASTLVCGFVSSLTEVYHVPGLSAFTGGAIGFLAGIVLSPLFVVLALLRVCLAAADRFSVGIANGLCGGSCEYILDQRYRFGVVETFEITKELNECKNRGIDTFRRNELCRALHTVTQASDIFRQAKPQLSSRQTHYLVVKLKDLKAAIEEAPKDIDVGVPDLGLVLDTLDLVARLPVKAREATRVRESRLRRGGANSTKVLSVTDVHVTRPDIENTAYNRQDTGDLSTCSEDSQEHAADTDDDTEATLAMNESGDFEVSFSLFVATLQRVRSGVV